MDKFMVVCVSWRVPRGHVRYIVSIKRPTDNRGATLPSSNLCPDFDRIHPIVIHMHVCIAAFICQQHTVEGVLYLQVVHVYVSATGAREPEDAGRIVNASRGLVGTAVLHGNKQV